MILKELTELNGISGSEYNVMEFIKSHVEKYADNIQVDSMGNLIAFKKGIKGKYKVMLSAHMDEVGLMVTGYQDGMLKFKNVGGLDDRILPGKRVLVGDKRLPGIIGVKPIHLQERDERGVNIKLKSMYVDIGADKKEEAEVLAPLGEYIAFHSEYTELGNDVVKAKALDDRVGCAILMELIKEKYDFDLYVCFTVQEEVGLRGSEVAAYRIKPHLALVMEGTTCSDVPGVEEHSYSSTLGGGAVLTIMDRTSYSDKALVNYLYKLGEENNIKVQFKRTTTGGNDAGKIQLTGSGVKVASISVPCRYIHSPVSVMSKRDYNSCLELAKLALNEFNSDEIIGRLIDFKTGEN
ncbi:MAG TPA: M42 family metallopeptidase [Pseudobacteroides sp.]|uniref:M42 family metallopeptidase n=1 Tax=Pseudobacteroides sp. TaxID=1968840 RepID=UPI002F941790